VRSCGDVMHGRRYGCCIPVLSAGESVEAFTCECSDLHQRGGGALRQSLYITCNFRQQTVVTRLHVLTLGV